MSNHQPLNQNLIWAFNIRQLATSSHKYNRQTNYKTWIGNPTHAPMVTASLFRYFRAQQQFVTKITQRMDNENKNNHNDIKIGNKLKTVHDIPHCFRHIYN